jgi:hypothetical protein
MTGMLNTITPFLELAKVACKDYNMPSVGILGGIFWIMSKTRTDFLLFKQSIEKRMDIFEEQQDEQGMKLESHDSILHRHETQIALVSNGVIKTGSP